MPETTKQEGPWKVIVDTRKGTEYFVPMNLSTGDARTARKTRSRAEAEVRHLNAQAQPLCCDCKAVLSGTNASATRWCAECANKHAERATRQKRERQERES